MTQEIPARELRNNVSEVLRRVEAGARVRVAVSGRPVAELVPLPRRRPALAGAEWLRMRSQGRLADPDLLAELHELAPETTDDLPWP